MIKDEYERMERKIDLRVRAVLGVVLILGTVICLTTTDWDNDNQPGKPTSSLPTPAMVSPQPQQISPQSTPSPQSENFQPSN